MGKRDGEGVEGASLKGKKKEKTVKEEGEGELQS